MTVLDRASGLNAGGAQSCPDWPAVRGDEDGRVGMLGRNSSQGGDDACGHLVGSLAVAPRTGTGFWEASSDHLVGEPFPRAEVLLPQVRELVHAEARGGHGDLCSLSRSLEGAGINGIEALALELFGKRLRLGTTHVVERDVGVTLDTPFAIPVGLAMAHEEDRRRHTLKPSWAGGRRRQLLYSA